MIVAAWLFGPLFNAARKIPTNRVTQEGICLFRDVFLNQFWNNFEAAVTCIVAFFFPVIFILGLYMSIFHSLRKRATKGKLGHSDLMNKATTNVLKTSIFVTTCFFLCWVWNLSFFFLFSLGVSLSTTGIFYNFSVFMINLNCCINPFCYAVQYREFQSQVKTLFCKGKLYKPQEETSRNTCSTSITSVV